MDLLQESMLKLAKYYSNQPGDWPKLFQRIVQNSIRDWYRREKVRSLVFWKSSRTHNNESQSTEIDLELEPKAFVAGRYEPDKQYEREQISQNVTRCLRALPLKQQQVFLLRAYGEYSVKETAFAMQCSEGSVKTHYFRACKKLQEFLGDDML